MRAVLWITLGMFACDGGFDPMGGGHTGDSDLITDSSDSDADTGTGGGDHTGGGGNHTGGGGTSDTQNGGGETGDTSTPTGPDTGTDGKVILLEVGAKGSLAWVSLFNASTASQSIKDWKLLCGVGADLQNIALPDKTLNTATTYIVTNNASAFQSLFGYSADLESTRTCGLGVDPYSLQTSSGGLADQYGSNGSNGAGEPWEYTGKAAHRAHGVRKGGLFNFSQWSLAAANQADPRTR